MTARQQTPTDALTPKQRLYAAARAGGQTQAQAAAAAGIGERTGQRWDQLAEVRAEIRRLGDDLLADATRAARSEVRRSVEVIAQVRDDPNTPPAVRLSAAVRQVETAVKLAEQNDLAERVSELEARLGNVA